MYFDSAVTLGDVYQMSPLHTFNPGCAVFHNFLNISRVAWSVSDIENT